MEDILLVDDERPVLDSLLSSLDWAEYGFKHIHTAQSADEALDIMTSNNIDLLITDILMPGLSGLEMLKIIRSRFPATRCVLLSAHSKFEYARDALRLGVENYLLKPIDVAELRETVYRTVQNINYTNAISNDLFDRNILVRWLHGRISSDELIEHSRYTNLNVLLRRYRVLFVQAQGTAQRLMDRICASLGLNYITHPLLLDDSTGYLLVGGREVADNAIYESVHDLLSDWPHALIVCGTKATGNREVVQSRTDAAYASEYARLAGLTGWVSCDQINKEQLNIRALSQLEDILHIENPSQAINKWIGQQIGKISEEQHPHYYAQICLILDRIIRNHDTVASQQIRFSPYTGNATRTRTEELLCQSIMETVRILCRETKELSPTTSLLLKYVAENVSGSVSIKLFAEQTKMNSKYIGRLFKDEIGMYFSDYVCLIRINKAKALLETTNLSVGDIARQVGIYDVSYFTQCFKKLERISPMKYRQQYLQKKDSIEVMTTR